IQRARTSLPVPPSPSSKTGTLVPQIFSARRRTSSMATDRPNRTSSGSGGSRGLVVLFFLAFSDDIGPVHVRATGQDAHDRPLNEHTFNSSTVPELVVTLLFRITYRKDSPGNFGTTSGAR